MLNLDRVTLCCVDCVNQDLALAAIGQCVQKCEFGRVLFVTDRAFEVEGITALRIAPHSTRSVGASRSLVHDRAPSLAW